MATPLVLSSDGAAVLQASVPASEGFAQGGGGLSFDEFYEIADTAAWVRDVGVTRVALQLPDELLCDGPEVVARLQAALADVPGVLLFLLGDTSYGSCCVDEVNARHLGADSLVHYGRSCLSPATSLPVRYVFGRAPVDLDAAAAAFAEAMEAAEGATTWLLLFDVCYAHAAAELGARLPGGVVVGRVTAEWSPSPGAVRGVEGRLLAGHVLSLPDDLPLSACSVLFVGGSGVHLTTVATECSESPIYLYNPRAPAEGAVLQDLRTNKLLMKRFYLTQRAKDAEIIGLVVGTLGVGRFTEVLARCKALAAREEKKTYTFVVGKLNPAKLANFAEVDVFCLIACAENSLLDSAEYHAPVVTPFELEIALGEREWTGAYSADFRNLQLDEALANPVASEDEDAPYFSMVSGTYRSRAQREEQPAEAAAAGGGGGGAIVAYASPAADFLQSREFQGLEVRAGQDEPAELVQGHVGIARGYTNTS